MVDSNVGFPGCTPDVLSVYFNGSFPGGYKVMRFTFRFNTEPPQFIDEIMKSSVSTDRPTYYR